MESALILFEDNLVRNFYPITLMRPGLDLQLGPLSLLNWAKAILNPHSVQAYVRGYLRASVT
ncbi:MAG: putative sugar nucleotidyl transferase, partial [Nitrososphaerales archaeon]